MEILALRVKGRAHNSCPFPTPPLNKYANELEAK